jgi:hypothetical protein
MTESEYLELRETAWRRRLTPDEKSHLDAYLLVHPEAQQDWEEEAVLNQLLTNVPDAPLSSNFTALVLQQIELDERHSGRASSASWLHRLRSWLPRLAVTALVVGLAGLGYRQYEIHSLREKSKYLDTLVTSVASTFPDARIWEDFDAISKLGQPVAPARDEILWAALASTSTEQ